MKNTLTTIRLLSLLLLILSGCGGGGNGSSANDSASPTTEATLGQVLDGQGNPVAAVFSNAVDINDSNEVIGFAATTAVAPFAAALWSVDATGKAAVTPTPLSPLPGNAFSAAFAVDNLGNVVGQSAKGGARVAVLWKKGAPGDPLELPPLGAGDSAAHGISPDGSKIVGEAFDAATGTFRAVLWRVQLDGSVAAPQLLPTNVFVKITPQGNLAVVYSLASDVNDFGFIVGEVEDGDGVLHAAVWEPGSGISYVPVDLGSGGAALAINAAGQVVGELYGAGGTTAATLWSKVLQYQSTIIAPSGTASDISDEGRIAGWETIAGLPTAAVWNAADPGASSPLFIAGSQAYAINRVGMVAGRSGWIGFIKKIQ